MSPTPIRFQHLAWLALGLVLSMSPHIVRMPVFVPLAFLLLSLWRLLGAQGRLPLPDKQHRTLLWFKHFLAIVAFISVYQAVGNNLGREVGVALLIVLLGLKILELQTPRDYYIVIFLSYFLVISNFFYSQTMQTTVGMILVVIFITAGLVGFNDRTSALNTVSRVRLSGTLVLQSMPLMLVLFLLFPRISGPLWGLPSDANAAQSGLSDEMTPGSISQLGLSDDVAFRVAFDGPIPKPAELYWRGPVLWHTDGRTWTAGGQGLGPLVPIYASGQAYRYAVTLEAHNKRWLFALEMPTNTPALARTTRDLRLLSRRPVNRRIRYEVTSHTQFKIAEISAHEHDAALRLPRGFHSRSVDLAKRWASESNDTAAIVNRALQFFNHEEFVYTLTPPLTIGDPVDDFLFNSRSGFCEHYASAFVVLMRAAGIPARVVTGYQGGEINPVGDYMIIRQREAHAWAEVWTEAGGWRRVDPTAAVAPSRVQRGIDDLLPGISGAFGIAVQRDSAAGRLLRNMRNSWDAMNNGWNQWVLGYGPMRQRQLFSRLGIQDPRWEHYALMTLISTCTILILVGLRALTAAEHPADQVRALYDRFCAGAVSG
jgi:transglutaminase-like putative cysteine protease